MIYVGHIIQNPRSLEKAVILRKAEGEKTEQTAAKWMDSVTIGMKVPFDLKDPGRDR